MGSGSSKAKRLTVKETSDVTSRPPVANVNKPESLTLDTEIATKATSPANNNNNNVSKGESERQTKISENASKLSFWGDERGRFDKVKKAQEDNYNDNNGSPTELQFKDESDYNDDIDKILEIPVAVGKPKQSVNKQKKTKQERGGMSKEAEKQQNAGTANVLADAPLPETYAQRMQRQQYKLQQGSLFGESDPVKASTNWQQESEENDVNRGSSQTGFDASKFRAVNKGRDFRKDLPPASSEGMKIQHYVQSSSTTREDFDDFGLTTQKYISTTKQIPQYNQSELELMKQLEDDFFL